MSIGIGLGLLTDPGQGVTLDPAGATAPKNDRLVDRLPHRHRADQPGRRVRRAATSSRSSSSPSSSAPPPCWSASRPSRSWRSTASLLEIVQKALWWVIRLAPIGTLGLIGNAVASYGWDLLGPAREVHHRRLRRLRHRAVRASTRCCWSLAGRLNPLRFFAGAWPAIELAFVSRSSVGTMPVTQRSVERLGVPREYASFAVPFGATTKMDGCAAIYPALAAIFVAQVFGVQLGISDYLLIAFVSVVGSAATAGLTGAIVMLTLTLEHAGPAAGRRRPAAGHRPDPGHDPHRHQRRRAGAGADHRRRPRGHPRPGRVRLRRPALT